MRDTPDDPWDTPWNALEEPVEPPTGGEAPLDKPTRLPRRLWSVLAGLLVWCSAFVLLYGGLSLGCEAGWQHSPRWPFCCCAAIPIVKIDPSGEQHPGPPHVQGGFMTRPALVLTAASAVCTAWIGWPVLFLPPCVAI